MERKMRVVKVYPKRDFDNMVRAGSYGESDSFVSINYTMVLNDAQHGVDAPVLPPDRPTLVLMFDDVLRDTRVHIIGQGEATSKAMTKEQAVEIIEFVRKSDGDIHVHCQMGKSRSVAAGIAIKTILEDDGHDVRLEIVHRDPSPNQWVLRTILEEWESYMPSTHEDWDEVKSIWQQQHISTPHEGRVFDWLKQNYNISRKV